MFILIIQYFAILHPKNINTCPASCLAGLLISFISNSLNQFRRQFTSFPTLKWNHVLSFRLYDEYGLLLVTYYCSIKPCMTEDGRGQVVKYSDWLGKAVPENTGLLLEDHISPD